MAKVTIEDISRRTGLSRGTVSRALNDRPDISVQTKQRVLEACAELNYVPSLAARSLATGRNYAIAALVADLTLPRSARFLRGVLHAAEAAGYDVHLIEWPSDPTVAGRRVRRLAAERIDGLVLGMGLDAEAGAVLKESIGERMLAASAPVGGLACDVFSPDFVEAGRVVARALLEMGGDPVVYVLRSRQPAGAETFAAFEQTWSAAARGGKLHVHGIDSDPGALEPLLRTASAVVGDDDATALGMLTICERLGRAAGRDVLIIGYGDTPTAASASLSSVDFGYEQIGRRAVETIVQRLNGERLDAPQSVRVAPILVQRGSCARLPRS